ncbi:Smr/MutS family protein [Roseomonas sp. OT10]|uniref:Smr/MutS family protein n=1 Tax=Roseomonas cutis TaxID=2897332 RepID=UPI001E4B1C42|nr:Smr/MutS family protein [Roseomonas sp. OT10]UFN48164.1 Smr/MutS family protein [Roseomonas sp. OT10]
MARRPRGLSEAERTLWRAWVARNGVAALPGHALPPDPPAPAPAAPPPAPAQAAPARPAVRPVARPPLPVLQVGLAPAGLDTRRWTDLRRGRMRPERTLDLHGRRAQEAHAAVVAFLHDAQADGIRCVAIVTGKGGRPGRDGLEAESGVLRRELPHWLNHPGLRPLLLGAAHPHAANSGAVHLLLRRRG